MIAVLVARYWKLAAVCVLFVAVVLQHDQLVTGRLKDKDQQAIVYNLRRDIADRDRDVLARASGEAGDRGDADQACATDITSSFQKGVAVGRAISNAPTSSPGAGQPAAGGLRDYRQAWAAGAFIPGS